MRSYHIALILSVFLPIFLLLYAFTHHYQSIQQTSDIKGYTIGRKTMVSAFIGNARYTITGYTSPFALVKLEGQGIYNETHADKNGRFIFENGFSPLSPREVCVTGIDTDGRITQPLCLAAFPIKKNISIGPLILPPTLSLNQPEFLINDNGILHGLSTPGSTIDINVSKDTSKQNITIQTHANQDGDYSVTLPTSHRDNVHVYSQSKFNKLESITSNLLTFQILPWWLIILKSFFGALISLKDNIITIVLIIEGCALGYLFWYFVGSKKTEHPLALRLDHFLAQRPPTQNKLDNPSE